MWSRIWGCQLPKNFGCPREPRASFHFDIFCILTKASIDLHVEQCLKKWEDIEKQKPRHKRKPAPECPSLAPDMTQEEFNEAAQSHGHRAFYHRVSTTL